MSVIVNKTTADSIAQWSHAAGEPSWLTAQRQAAWGEYQELPPPPRIAEAWKFTNLEKLAGWNESSWPSQHGASASEATSPQKGVIFCDIATALKEHSDLIKPLLTDSPLRLPFSSVTGQPYGGQRYVSQQEALWDRGFFLYVPKGMTVEAPIHGRITCNTAGVAIFPRTIIMLEEGAELTYVEEYHSDNKAETGTASCHARVEMYLAPQSRLKFVNVQDWHSGMRHLYHQHATVGQDAHFTSIGITLGGKVVKTVTESALTAPGAESLLFGIGFGNGSQHIDNHTLQTHLAPNTLSDLLFKMALKDQAESVYTGLIRMTEEADQGQAYQSNRNLLLSEQASVKAIPQLEIETNDVKCSHGATMGPVDEEQLFYLTSRGLSRHEAERMIVAGFFEDMIARIPDPQVEEIVRKAVATKLEG